MTERICLNGLWRWQPAEKTSDAVPTEKWGYFKVPGFWPGDSNYIQEDCQTLYRHPSWMDANLRATAIAWHSSFLVARLASNMGVASVTPILVRFHSPVDASSQEQRWLAGPYLDVPEEWDDPYRFFRW